MKDWFFNLSTRDRRALTLLVLSGILMAGYHYLAPDPAAEVVGGIDSVPLAENRLNSLRQIAAALPAKEAALKQVEADLAAREKFILNASTAAQAGARLLEVSRRVGSNNGIEIRGGNFDNPKTFGDSYGQVFASVSFNCRIEQFVNFFAELSREPDLIAPSELTMNLSDATNKVLSVRMTLAGVVTRKLVPEKKGFGL